jgi:hypothetical protein
VLKVFSSGGCSFDGHGRTLPLENERGFSKEIVGANGSALPRNDVHVCALGSDLQSAICSQKKASSCLLTRSDAFRGELDRAAQQGSVMPSLNSHCLSVWKSRILRASEGFRYGPFGFHDVFSRPRVEHPEDRAQLSSERGRRIFHSNGHFCKHLPSYKPVPLELAQLLCQHLLRDSRHSLPETFESKGFLTVQEPPKDNGFPSAADQHKQLFNRAHAGDSFGAHGSEVTRYPFGSWYQAESITVSDFKPEEMKHGRGSNF